MHGRVANLHVGEPLEDTRHDFLVSFQPEGGLDDHADGLETREANRFDFFFALDDKDFFTLWLGRSPEALGRRGACGC